MVKYNKIRPQDNKFTEVLDCIAVKPKILYYYGKLPETRPKTVAIVGARRNTRYGEEVAYKLAYELAKNGVVVVSGLAYGIDGIAHRGAVAAKGVTIGILGTEIERFYPRANENLAKRMVELGGAVLSEYRSGDKVHHKTSFLGRNRLIAGLADAVVVVEAAVKSGSLSTATHALDQNKMLFAVPGNIANPYSQGCNRLIKQGAEPYTGPEDVLNYLFPPEKRQHKIMEQMSIFGDNEVETKVLKALVEGMSDGGKIMEALEMDATEFNQVITILEIKGRVKALGMNQWCLL